MVTIITVVSINEINKNILSKAFELFFVFLPDTRNVYIVNFFRNVGYIII